LPPRSAAIPQAAKAQLDPNLAANRKAAFRAALKQIVGDSPVRAGRVKLTLPPLIDNGNSVPLSVSVESPMSEADHVKAIHVLTEKNPLPDVVGVVLGPRAGRASFATRVPPRRHPDRDRYRPDERRLVLVRRGGGGGYALGLPREGLI